MGKVWNKLIYMRKQGKILMVKFKWWVEDVTVKFFQVFMLKILTLNYWEKFTFSSFKKRKL
jgi:hypothetical protein